MFVDHDTMDYKRLARMSLLGRWRILSRRVFLMAQGCCGTAEQGAKANSLISLAWCQPISFRTETVARYSEPRESRTPWLRSGRRHARPPVAHLCNFGQRTPATSISCPQNEIHPMNYPTNVVSIHPYFKAH